MNHLTNGSADAATAVVLAHGAGAGMGHPFLERFADGLARRSLYVVRFEFPYMEAGRRAPDRPAVLTARWREVIERHRKPGRRLVIGGKSMGGRIASMEADEAAVDGLLCLGYPFHPPGRPEKLRTAHLEGLRTPTLILQGTRDPFGGPDEVPAYPLSAAIRVDWIEDGDHSFKPRKASGRTLEQNLDHAIDRAAAFASGPLPAGGR